MRTADARSTASGAAFAAFTLVGWSSVPLFLKYFTSYIDAWTANGWRYGLSALFWTPLLIVASRRKKLPPGLWKAAIVPAIVNCSGQCCFAWAPYYIDPGLMTFMLRFQIVFVAFGAYLLFPAERGVIGSPMYWLGVLAAFGGSLGVCLFGQGLPTGTTAFGIFLAIAAGILFGGYSLSVRYFMSQVRSAIAFGAISQYTACALLIIMLTVGRDHGLDAWTMTGGQFGMLALSALMGIALAHVFYYAAIARLGVAVAAGMILLQPFLTGASSYFLFGERLTGLQWLSGAAAMAGAAVMLRTQHRMSKRV